MVNASPLQKPPRVRVVTDSVSDMPADLAASLGITVIPCNVQFGQEVFLDGINLSREEFYARLVSGPILPTTSAPAVGIFEETYRRLAAEAERAGAPLEGIVTIHAAANLSAIYNSARLGAEAAAPAVRVVAIDSQQVSMSIGWLCVIAARLAAAGHSLDEIVAQVQALVPRAHLLAVLDTLQFVQRSGRIGKAQFLLGMLLSIKPLLEVRGGELLPLGTVRTRSRAIERLVELGASLAPYEEVAVMHARAPEVAQQVADMLAAWHPRERIVIGEIGVVLGTHAGPGAVGIGGLRAARSET